MDNFKSTSMKQYCKTLYKISSSTASFGYSIDFLNVVQNFVLLKENITRYYIFKQRKNEQGIGHFSNLNSFSFPVF